MIAEFKKFYVSTGVVGYTTASDCDVTVNVNLGIVISVTIESKGCDEITMTEHQFVSIFPGGKEVIELARDRSTQCPRG